MQEKTDPPPHVTIDLTYETYEGVLSICQSIVNCGAYVLHGSNVKPVLHRIEPRQANDAAKRSGNYLAVYASVDVDVVLLHAILNREYLSYRLGSYTIGYRVYSTGRFIKASDNLYQLFKQKDPRLFSDGYVYAMDRVGFFCCAPSSSSEFFAVQPMAPQKILKISASLSAYLFRIDRPDGDDTIVPYSIEEAKTLAIHQSGLDR